MLFRSFSRGRYALSGIASVALVVAACSGSKTASHASLDEGGGAGGAMATGGGASTTGGAGGATGQGGATAGQGGAPTLADPCPMGASPGLPAASPRILVLGPSMSNPALLATHLQGLLAADASFQSPEVVAQTSDTSGAGVSLMSFWYAPTDRDARLAALKGPFTWVVLLDDKNVALTYPEIHFEGTRVLACQARALGAKPIVLMTWSSASSETAARGEMAYRVGNGTGTPVVPTGFTPAGAGGAGGSGQVPVMPDTTGPFVAAASLYTAITGKSAAGTSYSATGISLSDQGTMIAAAAAGVAAHSTMTHYQAPFASSVKLQTVPPEPDFTFMDSGTSSEALWQDRMNEIVPKVGLTPKATAIGACNATKAFDATCLATAMASFATAQYEILFARDYSIPASMITAAGNQSKLTVQVWDRHYDNLPSDGAAAVAALEERSMYSIAQARNYGLAWVPYHLTFAKLKTARPAIALTSDGTHATYPVGYALATLSVVSRTSLTVPTAGLDADTAAGVGFATETIRHLSSLSQWGTFVPDDPATRPKVQ